MCSADLEFRVGSDGLSKSESTHSSLFYALKVADFFVATSSLTDESNYRSGISKYSLSFNTATDHLYLKLQRSLRNGTLRIR